MSHSLSQDEKLMQRALELSLKARVTAPPNPWVGCVILNEGEIVGEGFTQPPGKPHAEVVALEQAKTKTNKATVYVTLEPCSHFGRTPPCAKALIEAKVSRVVIGLQDPDANVRGQGIQQLRAAGIEVVTGICAHPIAQTLAPYLHHRRTGRPFCLAKGAISIDGRIAAKDHTSKWITSPEARREAHRHRAESQAIIVGAGTAMIDQPHLTVRDTDPMPLIPPLRVVLDAKGEVPAEGPLFDVTTASTLIVTTAECPELSVKTWQKLGVEVAFVSKAKSGFGVNLEETLDLLGKRNILQVLIEGGGTLLGAFLEAELIQHLSIDVGACILGNHGLPLFRTDMIDTLANGVKLTLLNTQTFGSTVRLNYSLTESQ